MADTLKKTQDVLTAARRDLQAQLDLVRKELARLSGEEQALTRALSSMEGGDGAGSRAASASGGPGRRRKAAAGKVAARKAPGGRRRSRAAIKSTADRVKELQALLADGPKSRSDLAARLKVSPARVQQLLAELGGAVSSQVAPGGRAKLWVLSQAANGSGAAKETGKRPSGAERTTTGGNGAAN